MNVLMGAANTASFIMNFRIIPMIVGHIRAEKHLGQTVESNLCLCCYECNRRKGSDIASVDSMSDEVVALFHPRRQKWEEHFALQGALITPLTAQGRVTVFLLKLNDDKRVWERAALLRARYYP